MNVKGKPSAEPSVLPKLAGIALLLEALGEPRSPWIVELLESATADRLATDEAFVEWLQEERRRDPTLVGRLRQVLAVYREDLARGLLKPGRARSEFN